MSLIDDKIMRADEGSMVRMESWKRRVKSKSERHPSIAGPKTRSASIEQLMMVAHAGRDGETGQAASSSRDNHELGELMRPKG